MYSKSVSYTHLKKAARYTIFHSITRCFKKVKTDRSVLVAEELSLSLIHIFSDTFGKSAHAILDKILENPADTSFDREPLVYKILKKKLPELRDAIDCYITPVSYTHLDVYKRQPLWTGKSPSLASAAASRC